MILQQNIEWCLNKLKLNIVKYKKIIILTYDCCISGYRLSRINSVKDLGINFDFKLTFTDHINIIVSNVYKALGYIYRNCQTFQNFNNCLVNSYILLYNLNLNTVK